MFGKKSKNETVNDTAKAVDKPSVKAESITEDKVCQNTDLQSDNNENDLQSDNNENKDNNYMVEGMCLGICFGSIFGQMFFDNLAIGLSIGMCIGLAIGSLIKK